MYDCMCAISNCSKNNVCEQFDVKNQYFKGSMSENYIQ